MEYYGIVWIINWVNYEIYFAYVKAYYKEEKRRNRKMKGCRDSKGLGINHTGIIKGTGREMLCMYEITIRNQGNQKIDEIYIYYHLHYKLRLVPYSLCVNNVSRKGGIEYLRLPWLRSDGKDEYFVKISFKAIVRKEFMKDIWEGKTCCFRNRMQCKYKGELGRIVSMPTNCIKLKLEERKAEYLRSEPVEIRQKLYLTKEYKPIYAIDHVELALEQDTYTIILHYYSEYGRIFTYRQTESLKHMGLDLRYRIVGEIQSTPVLLGERVLEMNIIFWNE